MVSQVGKWIKVSEKPMPTKADPEMNLWLAVSHQIGKGGRFLALVNSYFSPWTDNKDTQVTHWMVVNVPDLPNE